MSKPQRNAIETREEILKMLSDDENRRVSTAEAAARLADGEDYLDLEHLDRGVLHASGGRTSANNVLPRNAVREATWGAILERLRTD